jgi:hypothetical protein
MQQVLYLRRLRDFGEKIADSFLFLKQHWKNLFGIYLVFVVPFIMAAIIVAMVFAGKLYSMSLSNAEAIRPSDIFGFDFVIILLCFVVAITSYNTAVFSYFRLCDEQRGVKPTIAQVGQLYFRKLLKIFLYNIVVGFILVLVIIVPYLIVAFIPLINLLGQFAIGVFFSTVLLHLNLIFIREDQGLSAGISRLFYLFGGNWWKTIGFSLVMFLIYYVFSFVLIVILTMLSMIVYAAFLIPRSAALGGGKSMVTLITLAIGAFFLLQQTFYLILFCAAGINYFSLSEEKDGSAIEELIDSIGTVTDKYGGIEEQY